MSNINVQNIRMFSSMNGLRIKTYQGGQGQVSGVQYNNVYMTNVYNPIVITQVSGHHAETLPYAMLCYS